MSTPNNGGSTSSQQIVTQTPPNWSCEPCFHCRKQFPNCNCVGNPTTVQFTSRTDDNPLRDFQRCAKGKREDGGCDFWEWNDPPICSVLKEKLVSEFKRYKKLIDQEQSKVDSMRTMVDHQESVIGLKDAVIFERNEVIREKEMIIMEKDQLIQELDVDSSIKDEVIHELGVDLSNKDVEMKKLTDELRKMKVENACVKGMLMMVFVLLMVGVFVAGSVSGRV